MTVAAHRILEKTEWWPPSTGAIQAMTTRQLPADPLAFIQRCVRQRKIFWTYHVNMRLERRHIARSDILDAVETYEIVEAYPDDKYLPSYLVIAAETFHVLFAVDIMGDNVRIVTAYRPTWADWMPDLRTRRTH